MVIGLVGLIGAARAETRVATTEPVPAETTATASEPASRDFHIGANLRTDFGARFYRLDLGVRLDRLDLILVVDPFGVQNTDYDTDAIVRFALSDHWSVFGGARITTTPIGRTRQWSEKALVGVSGVMPSIGLPWLRMHAGAELAVHVMSHGGDLPTHYVCIDSPTCRKDHFVFGMFGRFEYVAPF